MVDAPRPEPPLRDLKAPALAEQHVPKRGGPAMLPVSRRAQWTAPDAQPIRGLAAAQQAYCRFVGAGPWNSKLSSSGVAQCDGGMNRVHSHSARAFHFSPSTTGT